MIDNAEILTKVYGYVNLIKVRLAFDDIAGIWEAVNDLSDYLVSVDCAPTQDAPDGAKRRLTGRNGKPTNVLADGTLDPAPPVI